MNRIFSALALATLVFSLQLGTANQADAAPGLSAGTTYKCKWDGTWCTPPLPDQKNKECGLGALDNCREYTNHNGCLRCAASSTPVVVGN